MTKRRIIVCDDEEDRATAFAEAISGAPNVSGNFEVDRLSTGDFVEQIALLEARRGAARDESPLPSASAPFDDAEMVVIDFDLVQLTHASGDRQSGLSETGERVAYLARCYSSAKTIVTLNEFATTQTFNLRLDGHLESYADVNITSDVLGSPGLWSDDWVGFRPWAWPCLATEPARHDQLVEMVMSDPTRPVLEALQLDTGPGYEALTRGHLEYLAADANPEMVTFEHFVTASKLGLHPLDKLWQRKAIGRICAARLSKWLHHVVVAGQNILVDAPHLVSRFPSLVRGDSSDLETLNATTRVCAAESVELHAELVTAAEYGAGLWLGRPTWLWPTLRDDERIEEVKDPWEHQVSNAVFCEDTSSFVLREDGATEFYPPVISEYQRRYVERLDWVRYEPAVFFAL